MQFFIFSVEFAFLDLSPSPPPSSFTLLSILSLHWSFVFEAEAFHRHWACLAAVSKCI